MNPPIVVIHRGDSHYLPDTIAQARASNPGRRIILIGDRSNNNYLGVEHHCYSDYFSEAEDFAKIYKREHFDTYQYRWILFCHQKYFILREFCRRNQIKKLLFIDSDVMIYDDIDKYFEYYSQFQLTLHEFPKSIHANACISFINDTSILDLHCKTYEVLYREPLIQLREKFGVNLFHEMIGHHILLNTYPDRVYNLYAYRKEDHVFPASSFWDHRFTSEGKLVSITWRDDTPYISEIGSSDLVKAPILHFQGDKTLMKKNIRIRNPLVFVEWKINRCLRIVLKYPMRLLNKVTSKEIYPAI